LPPLNIYRVIGEAAAQRPARLFDVAWSFVCRVQHPQATAAPSRGGVGTVLSITCTVSQASFKAHELSLAAVRGEVHLDPKPNFFRLTGWLEQNYGCYSAKPKNSVTGNAIFMAENV